MADDTATAIPTGPSSRVITVVLAVGFFVPVLLYFTYMMLASLLFFLVTGTVGFLSAWAFVHVIYGAIKVD